MEERYYSPLKAAEVTGANINHIKQLAVSGELPIYLPDPITGIRLEEPLFRYATAQFFNSPEQKHWPFCDIWKIDAFSECPADCELRKGGHQECGPEADRCKGDHRIPYVKLEHLIILESGIEIIRGQAITTKEHLHDKLQQYEFAAEKYVAESKANGLSYQKIAKDLKENTKLTAVEIYDLIHPENKHLPYDTRRQYYYRL